MEVIKGISIEELQTKDEGWFREQYYLIFSELRKKQQIASTYATSYYRLNREKILKKRQEQHKVKVSSRQPKLRGRPRKYTLASSNESEEAQSPVYSPISPTSEHEVESQPSEYEVDLLIVS